MPTTVTYYTEPLNHDYLMTVTRSLFGDLTGDTYSDTVVRTSQVNAIRFLQNRWLSKYQIYEDRLLVSPQPSDVPAGYVLINSVNGQMYVPNTLVDGDVFRNGYIEFTQESPPIIESKDEMAIVLAAVYLLRSLQVSSSSTSLVSWATEDIRYSNLGSERSQARLLTDALAALNDYFTNRLATPRKVTFPITSIPGYDI